MQLATLSYQYKPKENINGDSRAKLCHRHLRSTVTNVEKKPKQRRSLYSDLTLHSNGQLPPITTIDRRRSSMRIKGSSLPSSKLGDLSSHSFHHQSRSHSRLSNSSEHFDIRSRSISPAVIARPASKLIRMKFGHPIKLRSPDFYGPDKSEAELHLREDSFVNDSIRASCQNIRSSLIPPYEPLDDPHLRRFFQSPIVLDIVRKTLNVDPNNSYKQEGRSSKMSAILKRSKSNGAYDKHNEDYLRISKGSSGYAKLNGYDCIPSHSTARQFYSEIDPNISGSQRWNTVESRFNYPSTREKIRRSTSISMTSFPTTDTNQLKEQKKKKKTRRYEKTKLKPTATSSALQTTPNIESSSMTKMNDNLPPNVSQDLH